MFLRIAIVDQPHGAADSAAAGNIVLFLNPRAEMILLGARYSMFDIGGAVRIVEMAVVLAASVLEGSGAGSAGATKLTASARLVTSLSGRNG